MLRTLLSRSRLLRRLRLKFCSGIGHLNIRATNLEVLSIIGNSGIDSLSFVDTPQLRYCFIALGKNKASLMRGKTPSLVEFLTELPRVFDLLLDSYFLELLAADGGSGRLPTRSTHLNSLSIHAMLFSNVDDISRTLLLIRSCPSMTKLKLWFCPTTNTFDERVVNYFEASACMFLSEQTLTALLSVNILRLKGLKPQLLLIKLLLACSPKLETLFIVLSLQLDLKGVFKISKELSEFPRLSPKAAVRYSYSY